MRFPKIKNVYFQYKNGRKKEKNEDHDPGTKKMIKFQTESFSIEN